MTILTNLKEIKYPRMSESLAELIGICFGDGCLVVNEKKHDYYLAITGHLIDDMLYLRKHVAGLIKNLFGIEPVFYEAKNSNSQNLVLRSKNLVKFLHDIGMPIGKKYRLTIPESIKNDNNLMFAFIRGFFDTDGTLTFQRNVKRYCTYPRISISSKEKGIIFEIKEFLIDEGFKIGKIFNYYDNYYKRGYHIYKLFIHGRKNLKKWMSEIGFSNPKHKTKYQIWKKLGYHIPFLSTPERMKIISGERDSNPQPRGLFLSQAFASKDR